LLLPNPVVEIIVYDNQHCVLSLPFIEHYLLHIVKVIIVL